MIFKGLGVQKDTQTPCWLRPYTDCFDQCLSQQGGKATFGQTNIPTTNIFFLKCHFQRNIVKPWLNDFEKESSKESIYLL